MLLGAPVAAAQAAGVADGVPVSGSPGVASNELVATGLGALPTPPLDHEKAIEEGKDESDAARGESDRGDVSGPGVGESGRLLHPVANPSSPPTPRARLLRTTPARTALTSTFSFSGPTLDDSGAYPPDTQGDVGPSQYIVAINGRFRSYSKSTGLADGALDADPDQFFSTVMTAGTNFTSDPHIRYDRLSQRWFIVMIDVPGGQGKLANRYLLAVSSGPTITGPGSWTLYDWPADLSTQTEHQFADYPTLGVDQNALYIGGNMFATTGAGAYSGSRVYVVRKSSVTGGGPIVVTKFVTGTASTGLFTPQGVDDRTGNSSVGWFVGVDQASFGLVDFHKITTPGGVPALGAIQQVTVPDTALPVSVPHLGNTDGVDGNIDALDDRLFSANLRAGHIWTAHAIGVDSGGVASGTSDRDASRWYDFDVSSGGPLLTQSGTVADTSQTGTPLSYTIPTVNVNGQGIVAMGGTVAGAAAYINAYFAGRQPSDAAGAMQTPTLTTNASAAYDPTGDRPAAGSGPRRWGDYSFVSVDPQDDQTMWSIQEFTATANIWGTRITKLIAPAPSAATATPRTLSAGPVINHVVISGSGFFDPGAAFPSRLTVTSTCGATSITVTGVSADVVNADVVVPTAQTCGFTVTNPDGQSSTVSTNHAPLTVADAGTVQQDAQLDGTSVLANDSDPEGDALTAALVASPSHGTAAVSTDGTYRYVPATGFIGDDSFTYRANDGALDSVPTTVSITVTAKPTVTTPTTTTTTTPTSTTPTLRPGTTPTCAIPAVKGITSAKAKAKLAAAGCTTVTVKRVRSTKVRPNRSLQTVPAAGTVVKAATPVVLQVTYPLCKVPKVAGLTLAKAKRKLKAAACFRVTVKKVAGGRTGRVAKTSPKAGKTVKASGRVTVSLGR